MLSGEKEVRKPKRRRSVKKLDDDELIKEAELAERMIRKLLERSKNLSLRLYGRWPPKLPFIEWDERLKELAREFRYWTRRSKRIFSEVLRRDRYYTRRRFERFGRLMERYHEALVRGREG